MTGRLVAPFVYHGGKRRWADKVWDRFGDDRMVYLEPFAGSLAVLLSNPKPCLSEKVCDLSPHIANFWRAVKHDPDAVAWHADYPTIHHDLVCRAAWLSKWAQDNDAQVMGDADYFDAKAAGWWAWGKAHWIAADWPPVGAADSIPKVATGRGGGPSGGTGVSAQRTDLRGPPLTGCRLRPWMRRLADRLANVVVLRRQWRSCVTRLMATETAPVAVFLDPPYRGTDLYADVGDAAEESYRWAVEQGDDPRFRIAYCGAEGDFPVPAGWSMSAKSMKGSRLGVRDVVMFSPHCLDSAMPRLF